MEFSKFAQSLEKSYWIYADIFPKKDSPLSFVV